MAVDYSHRLIVRGPHDKVRTFRRQMHREYPRALAGETWTEVVPFSLAALYEIAPAARRIEREIPFDPYELCHWPIRRLTIRRSEIRYRFHTRNLEMIGLIRTLSRALSSLTFLLTTFCLDDSSIIAYHIRNGRVQQWILPERRQQFYWQRALARFGLATEDEVYESEEAREWCEEEMLAEAVGHWDKGRKRTYRWWNRIPLRDLATERELALCEVAEALSARDRRSTKNRGASSRQRIRRPTQAKR